MYIGHKRGDGEIQPLKAHLEGVAKLAAEYARPFEAAEHARRTALLHDIGKYSPMGQRRQADPDRVKPVDHSTAGAKEAMRLGDGFAAFAVAGHHGGLTDLGPRRAAPPGTLTHRLAKPLEGGLDPSAFREEILPQPGDLAPRWLKTCNAFQQSLYIRMLFSSLVDADFLDTERFMQGETDRGGGDCMAELLRRLRAHVAPWLKSPKNELNRKRSEILAQCLRGDGMPRGLWTLTVPTGGGKTVSSLAFALSHAAAHGLVRVIYVVPYTSIIEQNAEIFAEILGRDNVLEHHSNVDFDEQEDAADDHAKRLRLATENWDAPVVVTTAVQFFESLFAARTSRCRKLHNIAQSVIVFDEAQMLPLSYLRPCVAAIADLAEHYGATAVLCTATQPALNGLFAEFAPKLKIEEICPGTGELYRFFRRVSFAHEGRLSVEGIAGHLAGASQGLCIVNTRRRAQQVYDLLPREGRFHLSTLMTPNHRSKTLKEIRRRLKAGKACRVVSTSLIEAGVDVDFPTVWREEAGLDSILQAAGRCNREGRRSAAESVVHVFSAEGGAPTQIQQNVAAMRMAVENWDQPDGLDAIHAYFRKLMDLRAASIDYKDIMTKCADLKFAAVARDFQLIDEDTVAVYIPTEENAPDLERLLRDGPSKKLLRKLGRDAVNVYRRQLPELTGSGKVQIKGDGFAILEDRSLYDAEKGLAVKPEAGVGLYM